MANREMIEIAGPVSRAAVEAAVAAALPGVDGIVVSYDRDDDRPWLVTLPAAGTPEACAALARRGFAALAEATPWELAHFSADGGDDPATTRPALARA